MAQQTNKFYTQISKSGRPVCTGTWNRKTRTIVKEITTPKYRTTHSWNGRSGGHSVVGGYVYEVAKGSIRLNGGAITYEKGDKWRRKSGLSKKEWRESTKDELRGMKGSPFRKKGKAVTKVPVAERCSGCDERRKLPKDYLCHECRFGEYHEE